MAASFPSSSSQAAGSHMPSSTIDKREMDDLLRRVRGPQLYNRQLSSICQVNGLKSTGVKADLQRRITDLIQDTYNSNDATRYQQVRYSILNSMPKRPNSQKPTPGRSAANASLPGTASYGAAVGSPHAPTNGHSQGLGSYQAHQPGSSAGLEFQPSPFYTIESSITDILTCPIMSGHRNSIRITLRLSDDPALQKCVDDTSYRVMMFCAGDSIGPQHVAFPYQSELKVNGGDFKANLRGLKNRPGSTRPVDITSALRLRSTYTNNIEFTYALTAKKFYVVLYLCKVKSVADLVAVVSTRQRIPKESVISEINKKALDPDVVAVSQVLSLKCPLSYMRLDVPCRGTRCSHIQCFDSTSYLQLQEQGPQWSCPICSNPVPFEQLAVDEYVKDILQKTSKDQEVVTIEPNGQWSAKSAEQERSQPTNYRSSFGVGGGDGDGDDDDDDDDLEISAVSVVGGRGLGTPKTPTPSQTVNTPTPGNGNGGDASAGPRGAGSTSSKRPAREVIDLTLSSDDEDDEPIRRPGKRQNTGTNGFGGATSGRMGFLSESPLEFPR